MEAVKGKFAELPFSLNSGEHSLPMKGLFSSFGITHISLDGALPGYWRQRLGVPVQVQVGFELIEGVFLQQIVEEGVYYEVRFRKLTESNRDFLRERLLEDGRAPHWNRQFPRIAISKDADPSLPTPGLCMVRGKGNDVVLNVMNFTVNGLRLELHADQLPDVRVGMPLTMDLLISNGDILTNLMGEARNIALYESVGADESNKVRSLGVRLQNLDPGTEKKYREMIRAYVMGLQKKP